MITHKSFHGVRFLLVCLFLGGAMMVGTAQNIQKKGGIFKPKKGKIVEHHKKMEKKKKNHTKTWNQYNKTKNQSFLKKKKKKQGS